MTQPPLRYRLTLSNGRVAFIDLDDAPRVLTLRWHWRCSRGKEYAWAHWRTAEGKRTTIGLHRFIMGDPPGMEVDHEDGDGLNCTRENMRVCTHAQNQANMRSRRGSTGYVGGHHVGSYRPDQLEQAVRDRDRKALELHGPFARLNLPLEP